jgi:hypothetical protein
MEPQATLGGGQMLMLLLWAIVIVIPFWRLSIKNGFPGWMAILMVVPIANIVYLYVLAFSDRPARQPHEH